MENSNSKIIKDRPIMPLLLQLALGIWMSGVIVATFIYLPAAKGFSAPEAARIIIFHVPCAMIAVLAYLVSTVYAVAYLVKGNPSFDTKSAASAGLGFLFTILATITGMVFARIQWGAAWNWDPRETSILMLIIVYAAYFALRSAIPSAVVRARSSAAYNILACLVMPYLVFVLPRIMGGLHPSNVALSSDYRIVLRCSMVGFVWLFIWIFRISVRISEYELSRRRKRNV